MVSCTILSGAQTYPDLSFDLTNTDVKDALQRTSPPDCGVKMFNVSPSSNNTNWTLTATSKSGETVTSDFHLQVIPADRWEKDPIVLKGILGSSLNLRCNDKGQFCEMWEEGSKSEGCLLKTHFPKRVQTQKQIRCRTFLKGSADPVIRTWTLIGQYPFTTPEYLNLESSLVLRCKSRTLGISACFIRQLNMDEMYQVADGLNGMKYSSYRTQYSEGVCDFEIPKTLIRGGWGEDSWLMKVQWKGQGIEECFFDRDEIMKLRGV